MGPELEVLNEIIKFFSDKFETKTNQRGYNYASHRLDWLIKLGLNENSSEEAITKQTIKKLQEHLLLQFGMKRIKIEAKVAENMTLRFSDEDLQNNKVV